MARDLLTSTVMQSERPSLEEVEVRLVTGGAARDDRQANVALALQRLESHGTVANWVDRTASAKHGLVNCGCGCGLPNCR